MGQSSAAGQWPLQDAALLKEQQKLAADKNRLEQEKREFHWKQQMEEKRLAQEAHLFEMKWKILEDELHNLAKEKQEIAQERERYFSGQKHGDEAQSIDAGFINGALFFSGVRNEPALKKRYKELIKIFHPDNADGDTGILQEINRQYDSLKKTFAS